MRRVAVALRVARTEVGQRLTHRRLRRRGMTIDPGAMILGDCSFDGTDISIGTGALVQSSALDGRGGLHIGAHAIVNRARIITAQHDLDDPTCPTTYAPVTIGEYAIVFTDAIVLPGVTLGRGSVVAAGTVVTKDVAAMDIVAGNPARVVRRREKVHDRSELRRGNGFISRRR